MVRWLTEHLAYNLDVHREYYRLRESTVELTKVSRLLTAIVDRKTSEMAEQNQAEISVEDIFSICLLFIEKITETFNFS